MFKKSALALATGILLASTSLACVDNAATMANRKACAKAGAVSTIKV